MNFSTQSRTLCKVTPRCTSHHIRHDGSPRINAHGETSRLDAPNKSKRHGDTYRRPRLVRVNTRDLNYRVLTPQLRLFAIGLENPR